jgi:hypothetical protein
VKKVDIRPGVSMLAVLRHLNYRPWFALGEFVDNAVESFAKHQEALAKIEGKDLKLRVDINISTASPALGSQYAISPRASSNRSTHEHSDRQRFRQIDQGLPNSAWG